MEDSTVDDSDITKLETQVGSNWAAIRKARRDTVARQQELASQFRDLTSSDAGLVVLGSLARGELTSGSDLDWILLIDSQTFPEHKAQELVIERRLADADFIKPGKSGIFGRMVGSHALIHDIGGEDDLNSNTTRRILLLLEALPVGNREAYDRVRRQILKRYFLDDRGLTHGHSAIRIPRFLLNDLTRYWRTITVDFVYKQRADGDEKWGLRNAKLRFSRKLIFASGILACFSCHLDSGAEKAQEALRVAKDVAPLTDYVERLLERTPLEIVAKVCLEKEIAPEVVRQIFHSYDCFLALLDNPAKRQQLVEARDHSELRSSAAWKEVQAISDPFHEGLVSLFFKSNEELSQLTMKYGVF